MNIIKVKDYDSMQAITVSLAKNGYLVTADSVTDEHYKEHWEIKYCELSEITEKPNINDDFDGDYLGSMTINNKKSTKGVKCGTLKDEKSSVENKKETIDPESEPVISDIDENDVTLDVNPLAKDEEIPRWRRTDKVVPNSYGLKSRDKTPDVPLIPTGDTSDNITDESMVVITSVSGN